VTPTSPLAGLLTGLVDGLVIAAVVFAVLVLLSRRRRATVPVRHAVADDEAVQGRAYRPHDSVHPSGFGPTRER
jgi:hypothetical protein